jgi:DNA invertase Pin-like site-specific DNA recombinase
MKVSYIRVSSVEQKTDRQLRIDIEKTYIDKCSGSISFKERDKAKRLMSDIEKGLITEINVHSIDRLGRNTLDIMQTIEYFTSKGVNLISDKEGLQTLINGKENPIAKMIVGILGTLAEFELKRIKERQAEGIAKAKDKGRFVGRKIGSLESTEDFLKKESTQKILKYLREKESIKRTALLSQTSEGTVKKVKKKIRNGEIVL